MNSASLARKLTSLVTAAGLLLSSLAGPLAPAAAQASTRAAVEQNPTTSIFGGEAKAGGGDTVFSAQAFKDT